MDYCSSCRRHLNGALVCPGCGAYAPDIAPATPVGGIVAAPAASGYAPGAATWDMWPGDPFTDATGAVYAVDAVAVPGGPEGAPPGKPADDLEGVSSAPPGRAARRRQRARWKKNQRRAVVATAVALVGGGLTLGSMERQAGDRAQAATAPKDPGMGGVEEQSAQDSRPTSAQPDVRRSSSSPSTASTPSTRSASADRPSRRYATDSLRTTRSDAESDTGTAPRTAVHSTSRQHSTTTSSTSSGATASDSTGTTNTTATTSTQTSAAGDDSATSTDTSTGSTGTDTSETSNDSGSASSSQLCVLVICLG